MFSVAVTRPGQLALVEIPLPEVGEYDVLVKTEIAFICNATDRKVLDGHFPGLGPENYPLLLGHETVGIVEKTGPRVRSFLPGDRAVGGLLLNPPGGTYGSGWGGHSEYVLIRDHRAMVEDGVADAAHGWDESLQIMKTVPPDIPLEAAGLLCTWREVYAGMFTDFPLSPGQDIVIFGAGPVGLSFIRFARLKGLGRIVSVDPLPVKRTRALAMGADEALAPDDPVLAEITASGQRPFDAVVDAVGHENIINAALPLIRMGGAVCVYGVVGSSTVSLKKETAPYNFNLYFHQWPTRTAEAAAQEPLIEWIREGFLDWRDFVTGVFPVAQVEKAVEAVKRPDSIKTMLAFA